MASLKKRILRGDRLTGGWLSLSSPIAAQIMAEAGYDVLMIDLEHTASDYLSAISLMQAVQAGGGTPVIRCSSADMVDIKRTLDAGPAGIMVPNIRDAAHAREVVAHCRYAPEGDRGAAPGYIRATAYSARIILFFIIRHIMSNFLFRNLLVIKFTQYRYCVIVLFSGNPSVEP